MQITFHGVRGSLPSPGPETASFGGNTSCVHVRLDCGTHLIFDAGTGIRQLGNRLIEHSDPLHLLLTHSHWDHIQGFPFFAPLFQPDREIHICRSLADGDAEYNGVLEQMNGHNFPVPWDRVPSRTGYMEDPHAFFAGHDFRFTRRTLNHPGGGNAYRISADGASMAFVTDNELDPPGAAATSWDEWVAFCQDADVLIHDAQYLPSDMPHKHGYGHSLVSQVRQLAFDANVGCLVLFHHDPDRTDLEVDRILRESEAWFETRKSRTSCLCAWEGLTLGVSRPSGDIPCFEINADRPFGLDRPMTDNMRLR
jgi:phosphoribosyl 1,2-cyclic phosphodiesterase